MRARNIKPGFFKNEELSDCDSLTRLLFIGLWCLADREGRLEYRPKRIKAEVFPYDSCNVVKMIGKLSEKKFITIYTIDGNDFIQIDNFKKHQNCHVKEGISTIQAPCLSGVSTIQAPAIPERAAPITESPLLNPESPLLNPESTLLAFDLFWKAYPRKVEKAYSLKCWKKLNGSRPPIEEILDAIKRQVEWRDKAPPGSFIPEWKYPATWINRGCWADENQAYMTGGNGNGRGNSSGTGQTYQKAGNAQSDGAEYPPDREF